MVPAIPGIEDLRVIGWGGYGVVYRGHQGALGRDVAVKVLSSPGADERAVDLWRREVTAMGRLSNHPNIVSAFSTGVTADGHPYLVMPYVPGGSLHDLVARHGPRPPADVVQVGVRLAGALSAAHAADVLHRDIKPGNVLLSEYGEPQLSDFGIARLVDATATTTGSVRATIGYAAPEVLGGEPATPAADVYGLGATLHTALAGRAPFAGEEGESLAARVGRVMTQPPPDLRPLGVPAALAEVVEAAMAKDPAARPVSADDLRRRLAALDGPAISAPPRPDAAATAVAPAVLAAGAEVATHPLRGEVDDEGHRRGPGPVVLAALCALLLVVFGLVGWALTRDGGDDQSPVAADPTTTAPPTSAETEATDPPTSATSSPPTSEAPSSIDPPSTTADTPTSTVPDPPTAGDLRTAVTDYYALVDAGELDQAYALLSPGFQADQDFAGYEAFWDGIASVSVVGRPEADPDALSATARLRFVRNDGSRSDESIELTFVTADDGTLLIDTDGQGSTDDDED